MGLFLESISIIVCEQLKAFLSTGQFVSVLSFKNGMNEQPFQQNQKPQLFDREGLGDHIFDCKAMRPL